MCKTKNYIGCFIFGVIILLILLPLSIVEIVNYFSKYNYYETDCNITKIDYPISLPTINNTQYWSHCSCGSNCQAWYPCVKLYSSHSNSFIKKKIYEDRNDECTFHDSSCPNGENVQYTQLYLIKAKDLYEEYMNKTINCYINEMDSDDIYLENESNLSELILFSSITAFIILCMCCCFIRYKCKN